MSIKSNSKAQVDFSIIFTLTVGQAKALDALAGYGDEAFLKVFYEKLGKSYLQPFEKDLLELFIKIRGDLGHEIYKIDEAKKAIDNALKGL